MVAVICGAWFLMTMVYLTAMVVHPVLFAVSQALTLGITEITHVNTAGISGGSMATAVWSLAAFPDAQSVEINHREYSLRPSGVFYQNMQHKRPLKSTDFRGLFQFLVIAARDLRVNMEIKCSLAKFTIAQYNLYYREVDSLC